MRVSRLTIAVILLVTMVPAGPAAAAPFDADPLELVPFADTVMRVYSQGTDTWEVWTCSVPDHSPTLDAASIVTNLESEIRPYFEWLSEGAYSPRFTVGGAVASNVAIAFGAPEAPFATD
ncbi:MAG TPA: hypothetical protein VLB67_14825, partial [Acidimicrobiia bacterium]|nr:hypothetical protein [Acidimicrobiia bacterium]